MFASYRMEMRFDAPAALLSTRTMLALDSWPDGAQRCRGGRGAQGTQVRLRVPMSV